MDDRIIVGEVDRISGSGNAMIRENDTEYNLGPMPESTVGTQVLAVPVTSTWAYCLAPPISTDNYHEKFENTANISQKDMSEAAKDSLSGGFEKLEDMPNRDIFTQISSTNMKPGDEIKATVIASTDEASYSILRGGKVVKIQYPFLETGADYPVVIERNTDDKIFAELSGEYIESIIESGDIIDVVVISDNGQNTFGRYDGIPIMLGNSPAERGETIRVAVEEVSPDQITANLESLPRRKRPSEGDVLTAEIDLPKESETTIYIRENIPISIEGGVYPFSGTADVEITKVDQNEITGKIDFHQFEGDDLTPGSVVELVDIAKVSNPATLVGYYENIPVGIRFDSPRNEIPNKLLVRIEEFSSDGIYGSFQAHPGLLDLKIDDLIKINVHTVNDQFLHGFHNDVPVWLNYSEPIHPDEIVIQVTDIRPDGLDGKMPTINEDTMEFDSVISVTDTIKHPQGLLAESDIQSGLHSNPHVLADLFEDEELAIVSQTDEEYLPEGIIIGIREDAGWKRLRPEIISYQKVLFAYRKKRFSKAAELFKELTESPTNDYIMADAQRGLYLSAAEDAIENNDYEKAYENLDDLKKDVLRISDGYIDMIEQEVDAYKKLVDATQRSKNGDQSMENNLQKIAVNISVLPLIRESISYIDDGREITFGNSTGLTISSPHPILIHRIEQLIEGFDNVPGEIQQLINDSQSIEELHWPVTELLLDNIFEEEYIDEARFLQPNNSDISVGNNSASLDGEKIVADESTAENPGRKDGEDPDLVTKEGKSDGNDGNTEFSHRRRQTSETLSDPTSNVGINEMVKNASPAEAETPDSAADYRNERSISDTELRQLRKIAESDASEKPVKDNPNTGGSRYNRSSAIKKYVKARAAGYCESCGNEAPFITANGEPYLEVHHVEELSQGGSDHPDLVVAICPTCHRRIHHGTNGDELNELLRDKLDSGLASIGVPEKTDRGHPD